MAASAASQRLERIERFLDNVDKVNTPGDLQDPFRSLWLRIHGEKPTMMSEERRDAMLSGGFSKELFGDVQITSASEGSKGSIEVISPKDVGPTVQMEMEEERFTFSMAKDDDLKVLESREGSADLMISLQKKLEPLSGLGGEVAKVWEGITGVAREYKSQHYQKAMDLGKSLEERIKTVDFRKSVVVELQKKINEYEELGADTTASKTKFKELAESLKEEKSDFIAIAGAVHSALESSIEGIVEEEIVAEVKGIPEPKEEAIAPKQKRVVKKKIEEEPLEEETAPEDEMVLDEEEEEPSPIEAPDEEKPVIKIVTVKKLVPVKKVRKERKEYREQVEQEEEIPEDPVEDEEAPEAIIDEEQEEEAPEAIIDKPEEEIVEEKPEPLEEVPEEGVKEEEPAPEETPEEKKSEEKMPDEGIDQEAVQAAFKKYQFVYNASLKMHEAGKDMGQLFDLMNFAEQARQKNDLKTYIGVCNQMESMLISLQS